MKHSYWEPVYSVVINISSGWFGVALIRDIFNYMDGGHGLMSMLYNLSMGLIYFSIALYIKEVKKLNA